MQENILQKFDSPNLRVYTVWLPILRRDNMRAVPEAVNLLHDPRVKHYWDGSKLTGRWFKKHVVPDTDGLVAWDIYFLYGPEAEWREEPEPLFGTGKPVIHVSDTFLLEVEELLKDVKE